MHHKTDFQQKRENLLQHSEQPVTKLSLLNLGSNLRPQNDYTYWNLFSTLKQILEKPNKLGFDFILSPTL